MRARLGLFTGVSALVGVGFLVAAPFATASTATSTASTATAGPALYSAAGGNITNVTYTVNGSLVNGLRGHAAPGAVVVVGFDVPANAVDTLGLAAYQAPAATWTYATADQQVLVDHQGGTFSAGHHSLSVTVPKCYYQVDFFSGTLPGTPHFGVSLIDADNGGTAACVSPIATTTTTVAPTTTTIAPTTTTVAPTTTSTTAVPETTTTVADVVIQATTTTTAVPDTTTTAVEAANVENTTTTTIPTAVESETVSSTPTSGLAFTGAEIGDVTAIGSLLTLVGAGLSGLGRKRRNRS